MTEETKLILEKIGELNVRFDIVDERLDAMDKRMDAMDKRFERIEERLDAMDKRMDAMDKRFDRIEERLDVMDKRMDAMDKRMDTMDKHFAEIDMRLDGIDIQIKKLNITLENELRRNISVVAEAHLDLSRKFDEALKIEKENEILHLRMNYVEGEVRKIKEHIGGIA